MASSVTGCIRPATLDRLNPNDAGGQYDSSGGAGGKGNPQGSVCEGYNHYVEVGAVPFLRGTECKFGVDRRTCWSPCLYQVLR